MVWGAYVADSLVDGGASCHVDDIVERDATLGCVIACLARDDGIRALRVEIFHAAGPPMRYVHTGTQELWPAQEVRAVIAWRRADRVSLTYDIRSLALGHRAIRYRCGNEART